MSILVKGKEVRSSEIKKGLTIEFDALNEDGQKRLFEENKDLFLAEAFVSFYKSIRELAKNYIYNDCPSKVLNQVISQLLLWQTSKTNRYINQILDILNAPNLKLENWLAMEFVNFDNYILKKWLVQEYNDVSNDLLNSILRSELDDFCDTGSNELIDSIIMHPTFELILKGENCGYGAIEKLERRIEELKK